MAKTLEEVMGKDIAARNAKKTEQKVDIPVPEDEMRKFVKGEKSSIKIGLDTSFLEETKEQIKECLDAEPTKSNFSIILTRSVVSCLAAFGIILLGALLVKLITILF